jgi:TraY domain
MSLRVTAEIKEQLEKAARRSGRSLSQEAELRLERSFAQDGAMAAALGGPEIERVARLMAAAFKDGGAAASGSPELPVEEWIRYPDMYQAAIDAVVDVLSVRKPKGRPS